MVVCVCGQYVSIIAPRELLAGGQFVVIVGGGFRPFFTSRTYYVKEAKRHYRARVLKKQDFTAEFI